MSDVLAELLLTKIRIIGACNPILSVLPFPDNRKIGSEPQLINLPPPLLFEKNSRKDPVC